MKYILIGAFVAFAALTSVKIVNAQAASSCHLRELDLCAATLVVFTQSPSGAATGDAELDKQCVYLREAENCLRNFTGRCMSKQQKELLGFVTDGAIKVLDEYCTAGSGLRKSYLKHATCLSTAARGSTKGCIKDLQTAFEIITSVKWDQRIPAGCCTVRRLLKCSGELIEEKCGKDASDFLHGLLRTALSRLPDIVCQNAADSKECNDILPPPGTPPKGTKSNSVLTRLFSAYTGL
jgi:hypothetical protein